MDSKKVLLVDDEVDFATLMQTVIDSWGYEVITAYNGEEAIEILKNENPQAVIVDYVMPDINGVELLRKIREIDSGIAAVMFTAHPTDRAIEGTKELNVAAWAMEADTAPCMSVSQATGISSSKRSEFARNQKK